MLLRRLASLWLYIDASTLVRIVGCPPAILDGELGPRRDVTIANAAAALLLAQKAPDLKSSVAMAAESIDSGAARRKLEQIIEFGAKAAL